MGILGLRVSTTVVGEVLSVWSVVSMPKSKPKCATLGLNREKGATYSETRLLHHVAAQTAEMLLPLPALVQILAILLHGNGHAAAMLVEEASLFPSRQVVDTPGADVPGQDAGAASDRRIMMLRLQQFRICNTRQTLSVAFLAIALVQALCDLSVV
jgi:hypothetical protein